MEKLQQAISKAKYAKQEIERAKKYAKGEVAFYLGSNSINNINLTNSLKADIKLALEKETRRLEIESKPLFDKLEALELLVSQ